jgi:hypothetical protein
MMNCPKLLKKFEAEYQGKTGQAKQPAKKRARQSKRVSTAKPVETSLNGEREASNQSFASSVTNSTENQEQKSECEHVIKVNSTYQNG